MRPDFPGMDPWLEHPALWPDVHNSLIAAIRDAISEQLPDRYFVALEERMVISVPWEATKVFRPDLIVASDRPAEPGPIGEAPKAGGEVLVLDIEFPADPITETYLEIREVEGASLITSIEVLSPSNKVHGDTRKEYLAKRHKLLLTWTNLVEIDLLRVGEPMPMPTREDVRSAAYRILLRRAWAHPSGRLYAFGVRVPIPDVSIPLLREDAEPIVRLNDLLHALQDRARYSKRVNYDRLPSPPLGEADAAWAREVIARAV
ncbi:DUF4058 family protein [Tautonia plasticadhaerens]|uniref:DUF4058 domain-containing protein n=1 Tax=Tautonia plasticadhaerens TaxID=2527974 RepID=A0A518GYF7_9BACT|nr:DUF4058 family protein [Tautonia plasticadhaerens]QDV33582.1 hypothetical protein ElP_14560 [Tautonia plasticadhaerens]